MSYQLQIGCVWMLSILVPNDFAPKNKPRLILLAKVTFFWQFGNDRSCQSVWHMKASVGMKFSLRKRASRRLALPVA